ncbi:MAG: sugar phosphate isomerase/epimerase family protein [Gemmatales bacterium]|nr:sugar phosphate isomerase/epimerase [Gemmatales bacterium]MDW8176470.1 sugar phosphate isomerase/epimerase family protein [Gemmatales bacterium]MDW8222683.1 sugar phosphate isomerase/epimerase family protein [Gemmatales bacterium]
MKLAIDSYCYHRYFGEYYDGLQQDVGERRTIWQVLARAQRLGCVGISLESCYLPAEEPDFRDALRADLQHRGLELVWAWGHPNGLRSGADRQAEADLVRHISFAKELGARVMRIVGGSWRTKPPRWSAHRKQLAAALRRVVRPAERMGIILALENHLDVTADQMRELMLMIDSPYLGVCLDTANNLRLYEYPVEVTEKLATWVRATHIKDVTAYQGDPRTFGFWPSVPLGEGAVEIPKILEILHQAHYQGLLAVEIDFLHPRYKSEDRAVAQSVRYLREQLARLTTQKPRDT